MSVKTPQITKPADSRAARRINRYYRHMQKSFLHYCEHHLFPLAAEEYRSALANSFPFRKFEAVFTYTETYNQNCTLSLYTDCYEFTGGAHGNTVRYADVWNLNTGEPRPLSSFFPPSTPLRRTLTAFAAEQAGAQIAAGEAMFFDDYRKLMSRNFNPQNFYLTEEGLAFYYQLYTIAPYVEGIVAFTLPYDENGPFPPSCSRGSNP